MSIIKKSKSKKDKEEHMKLFNDPMDYLDLSDPKYHKKRASDHKYKYLEESKSKLKPKKDGKINKSKSKLKPKKDGKINKSESKTKKSKKRYTDDDLPAKEPDYRAAMSHFATGPFGSGFGSIF